MMTTKGWIKIHRNITEMEEYFDERFSRMQCWIDLLLLAERSDRSFTRQGVRIMLKRGQQAVSVRQLAERWRLSPNTVRRRLSEMASRGRITMEKSSRTTVITIVNYDKYQSEGYADTKGNTRVDTAVDTPKDTKLSISNDLNINRDTIDRVQVVDSHVDTLSDTPADTPADTYYKNINNNKNFDAVDGAHAREDLSFLDPEEIAAQNTNQRYFDKYFSAYNTERLIVILRQLERENPETKTIADFKELARQVICEWELNGALVHESFSDWARHLINHIRIKNRKSVKRYDNNYRNSQYDNAELRKQQRDRELQETIQRMLSTPKVQEDVWDWSEFHDQIQSEQSDCVY